MRRKIFGGIMGLVVGDALGVPVEFMSRHELKANPVTTMREYGSHNQPRGTWSDDTSMALCLVDSLNSGLSYDDIAAKFLDWADTGYMTPYGEMFDIGRTTLAAIRKFAGGTSPLECGGSSEYDNGNGSLMRILPLAFYTHGMKKQMRFETVHNVSRLTHSHERTLIACGIYVQLACELLKGYSKEKAYHRMIDECKVVYKDEYELVHFQRVMGGEIQKLKEAEISSSGYVVDTLEAALWCLLTTDNFPDCILKAVNLGNDTDTVAAVAGGLAGILYGYHSIPEEWVAVIPKKQQIFELCEKFQTVCQPFLPLYTYMGYFESNPAYQWSGGKQKDGTITMPYPNYDKTLIEFTELPYDLGFMDYNYHDTLASYGCTVDDELIEVIATANTELILAVLTAYIRGERFCDGLWVSCVQNGVFVAILRRLKELEAS